MKVLRREWFNVTRGDIYTIVPLGDIHLGNAACDEALLRAAIEHIKNKDRCYWIGMGDLCDFINLRDPRFDPAALAGWINVGGLADLARVQRDKLLGYILPIASKCLGLVRGNHEDSIARHYERDVHGEIVSAVKEAGGFDADYQLSLDTYGWLLLAFYQNGGRNTSTRYSLNIHHGFTGGRLAGGKALNMQRWLWTHECDVALFGHSHNTSAQVETIETLDRAGHVRYRRAVGAYTGTFLSNASYAERAGYLPTPPGYIELVMRPGAERYEDRLKVVSG